MAQAQKPVTDPWAEEAKNFKPSGQPASPVQSGDDDWKIWQQGNNEPAAQPQTMMQKVMTGAEDLGKGMLKGAGQTANNIGSMMFPDSLARRVGMTPPTEQQKQSYFAPTNTAQKVGKIGEQAAEWLAPTGLEGEVGAAASKLLANSPRAAKLAVPLSKVAMAGMEGGARNASQGGSIGTGAALGAATGAMGQAGEALAPSWARTALRIPKKIDSRGVDTGRTILDLPGAPIRPESIAEASGQRIGELGQQLDSAVSRPGLPKVDQRPVISPVNRAIGETNNPNNLNDLTKLGKMVREDTNTGQLRPLDASPQEALRSRRDIDDMINSWETQPRGDRVMGATKQAYGAQTGGLHAAVPETVPLDRELSNQIPVHYYANRAANLKGVAENLLVPKGSSLTTAGAGLGFGASHTPEGAFLGAVGGRVIPEMLMSPTVRMGMARTIQSPWAPAAARAAVSPFLKKYGEE